MMQMELACTTQRLAHFNVQSSFSGSIYGWERHLEILKQIYGHRNEAQPNGGIEFWTDIQNMNKQKHRLRMTGSTK